MSATELLTAFSGESAARYASSFDVGQTGGIGSIEIFAVGVNDTTARYTEREQGWYEVNNILRIRAADGTEGISGVDTYYEGSYSDEHLQSLTSIRQELIGLDSLDPFIVGEYFRSTHPELTDEVRASIDIALWDLASKRSKIPLCEMLGAGRSTIGAYASIPFYEDLEWHVASVHAAAKHGYSVFKLHGWGVLDNDLALVKRVQNDFAGAGYRFILDVEESYELAHAVKLGQQTDEGMFEWLEGPINDEDFAGYQHLKENLQTKIVPAGYRLYSPEFFAQGIASRAWDAGRFDVTVAGGITNALKLLLQARRAKLPVEIQSWGYTLGQAANLHLMLANEHTSYFEAPMPFDAFAYGVADSFSLSGGSATLGSAYGLGVEMDWSVLPNADFFATA